MRRWALLGGFVLAAAGAALAATAGNLDDGFGSGGIVLSDFGGYDNDLAFGVAVQPDDGKIVAAGGYRHALGTTTNPIEDDRFTVARYDTDGDLDMAFGTDGVATVSLDGAGEPGLAIDLALDASGRIVVVGTVTDVEERTVTQGKGKNKTTTTTFVRAGTRMAVVRLTTNGSRDTTFGTNGVVLVDVPGCDDEIARSVEILADGDILVGGGGTFTSSSSGGGRKGRKSNGTVSGGAILLRLDGADGDLDATFGGGAVVTHDPDGSDNGIVIHGLGVQALEDRIVALGFDGAVRAYDLPTGAQDTSFASNGALLAASDEYWMRLHVDAYDDTVLICGHRSGDGLVARFSADGASDWSHVVSLTDPSSFNALGVDDQGSIVAGGQISGDAFVLRLDADGTADTSFGPSGIGESTSGSGLSLHVLDLAVDGTDVVLVGTGDVPNVSQDWFLARYCGTTDPATN